MPVVDAVKSLKLEVILSFVAIISNIYLLAYPVGGFNYAYIAVCISRNGMMKVFGSQAPPVVTGQTLAE